MAERPASEEPGWSGASAEEHLPPDMARRLYRRRRLRDTARMMPALGVFLFLLPALWQGGTDGGIGTSAGLTYLVGAWLGLILLAGGVARRLHNPIRQRAAQQNTRSPEP
ncbi:MAG: hypothetical protein AAFQ66_08585 [Pseudomonadota bacterium]